MLDFRAIKRQGTFQLDAAFQARDGITAIFGRSGAGKSSLISLIAGLSAPDQGRIVLGGTVLFDGNTQQNIPPERRRIGMVFQEARLFPHLSVRTNLRYGEKLVPPDQRWASFDRIVALLGIGDLLDRRPAKLSGGEKQRVAIGRALLSSPRLLVMDEPLAALDGARKKEVLPFIAQIPKEFGVPVIYVSHSIEEIIELADDMIILDQGKVVTAGPLEDVLSEKDLSAISGRQDAGSVLVANILEHVDAFSSTRLILGQNYLTIPRIDMPVNTKVRVRIAAQDVALALERPRRTSIQNILSGTVSAVSGLADGRVDVHVHLHDGPGGMLWTRITEISAAELGLKRGTPVFALIKGVSISRNAIVSRPD